MARTKVSLLSDLSTTDLKRLLAARERIDTLEKEKGQLLKALAVIDRELAGLMAAASAAGSAKSPARRKARRKTSEAKKKTGRAKAKTGSAAKAAPAGKGRKAAAGKQGARTAAKGKGRTKLEDVVAGIIGKRKGPVAFQEIYATIVKGKLFQSRSSNFDNVLRRTLSTSKKIRRVGRGLYDMA